MFWELAPRDVIGKPVNTQCPKVMNAWKRRKCNMEEALDSIWTQSQSNAVERIHTERILGFFFLDDRPFGTDFSFREVNVQSKAVFSYAVTSMDKIRGWRRQILDRVQEEYLWKRIMSIVLCTNWVCVGAFVDHEWVSSRKIFQQSKLMWGAWYNGAYCGSLRPRTWNASSELSWKLKK